jgi:hypothetical protein
MKTNNSKNNNKSMATLDDQIISSAVQGIRFSVPEHVDMKVSAALKDESAVRTRQFPCFGFFTAPRIWATVAACMLILTALYLFQPFNGSNASQESPMDEIKTEFQLKDKNIKILWVQKKDFKLYPGGKTK